MHQFKQEGRADFAVGGQVVVDGGAAAGLPRLLEAIDGFLDAGHGRGGRNERGIVGLGHGKSPQSGRRRLGSHLFEAFAHALQHPLHRPLAAADAGADLRRVAALQAEG